MAEIEDVDGPVMIEAYAAELGWKLLPWQLDMIHRVLHGEDHQVIYDRSKQGGKSIVFQMIQHMRNKDQLTYGQIVDDQMRWDTYCSEWGTPSLKRYLKRRWQDHIDNAASGNNVDTIWSTPWTDGEPYYSLDRSTDLTSWGFGISFDVDWRENRWDLSLEIGPTALALSRTGKRRSLR